MKYYIGIDLGTSSCKGLLVTADGGIVAEHSVEYPVLYPRDGWTEQEPERWLSAAETIIAELSRGREAEVAGLSFGGQMHGLVALDARDNVIRPAILWNDGRTEAQTRFLNEEVGKRKLSALTGNIAFAGFTAPKLLWMRENEPENFGRIAKIMLPKDYLAYKLTGVFSSDPSDASGTLLFDVQNRCWSREMCEICGVKAEWLPKIYESSEPIGKLLPKYKLPNCIVTAGAGDNAAAAIGTGTVENGACNISLGTSGTVFIAQDGFSVDGENALHSFAHANGKWHLMGCILSAASCRKWWLEGIIGTQDYAADAQSAENAKSDVIFLPYLSGERCPHNDTGVRGAFIGLSAQTTKAQMSRAVMEGVSFALRDCLDAAACENKPKSLTICGGGAKNKVWRQITADVFGLPVSVLKTEQGPSLGAAMLAMIGDGEYADASEAAAAIVSVAETVTPDPAEAARLEEKYRRFRAIYPALALSSVRRS